MAPVCALVNAGNAALQSALVAAAPERVTSSIGLEASNVPPAVNGDIRNGLVTDGSVFDSAAGLKENVFSGELSKSTWRSGPWVLLLPPLASEWASL